VANFFLGQSKGINETISVKYFFFNIIFAFIY